MVIIGQISRYMHICKMKYAFLTTYDQTIFFKQAPNPKRPQEQALWHSNVIYFNQANQDVSLRECFLFIGLRIQSGDYKCENKMSFKDWAGTPNGTYTDENYISPDYSSSSSERHSSPEPSTRATHRLREGQTFSRVTTRPQSHARHARELEDPRMQKRVRQARERERTRQEAVGMREITERTQALGLGRESGRGASPVRAYFDASGKPFVNVGGRSAYVTLLQDQRGRYYYKTSSGDRQYVVTK
ncbi:hypothetical protein N8T08_002071 [Aspergillus melleus]|uniref:Uncharacterized protein n=1 Tax=Aspergillus melleus TaxID=138277 RepID=A0ACC3AMQ7_9EURO|nr:hypothetical protein N8T08_002071 [Aspergillus melleus]